MSAPNPIHIRPVRPGDFLQVQALYQQLHDLHVQARPDVYRPAQALSREEFDAFCQNERFIALAAEEAGGLAGVCVAEVRGPSENPLLQKRRVAWVEALCVHPASRGKGIAAALMQALRESAAQQGASSIELNAWAFNEDALGFYEALGFAPQRLRLERAL